MQTAEGTAPKGSESKDTAKSEEVKVKPSVTPADATPESPESNDTAKSEQVDVKASAASANEKSAAASANTLRQLEKLIEESLQVYELENQKSATIDELFNSLKIITQFLSFTVNVHPAIFNASPDTTITLLPQLELVFRKANGKTEIKKLDAFPPEILTKILEYVIPLIVDLIRKEKEYLSEKITFLRSASKQLKQLHNLKESLTSDTEQDKDKEPVVVKEG